MPKVSGGSGTKTTSRCSKASNSTDGGTKRYARSNIFIRRWASVAACYRCWHVARQLISGQSVPAGPLRWRN